MDRELTPEQDYRQMAATARTLADSETDLYEKRQLLLAAQHYDILAERAKQRVFSEAQISLRRK